MSAPALNSSLITAATSNPSLLEFLLAQAQSEIAYHSNKLAYWQSIHAQLSSNDGFKSAAPSINPSMSPRTTHINPQASFRDGLASVIAGRGRSVNNEEDFSPASSPSPKMSHADRPKMKRPTSRIKAVASFVPSPTNAQSTTPTSQSNNQSNDEELKFSSNPLPPIPSTTRSGTASPLTSEPPSPNHANITAAASRRPPPLPPSQQNSRNNSRSQSPTRSSSNADQPTHQPPKQSPVHAAAVAPVNVDEEPSSASAQTPVSAAARFGGVQMMPIAAGDPSLELKARLQKRADGTAPPPLLKAQSASPTVNSGATTTVAECAQCGCKDFKQDAFKKNKCSNCFHVH